MRLWISRSVARSSRAHRSESLCAAAAFDDHGVANAAVDDRRESRAQQQRRTGNQQNMVHEKLITADLGNVIALKAKPGITIWNRLEGRPRADKFERALRAEVRDALWMITRQWQIGEFQGDDAGSPIFAKVRLESTSLRKYQSANGPVEEFNDAIPLEARVEQMPVPFVLADQEISLDIRLLVGRHWLKLISPRVSAAAVPNSSRSIRFMSRIPRKLSMRPLCACRGLVQLCGRG